MATAELIRVFVSSPGDVQQERDQLVGVVAELNTTLRAFMPDDRVVVELVRWETDVHPGMGEPQDVIDSQIGSYDIFLGIMWARFGTPTSKAGSGTEQEFRDVCKGWEDDRSPAQIMFYFCNEPTPAQRSKDDLLQQIQVLTFQDELRNKGLLRFYALHTAFADTVRPDLVLALSELVAERRKQDDGAPEADAVSDPELALIRDRVAAVCREYDTTRAAMDSGPERTRRLEVVASTMRTMAQSTVPLLPELGESDSAGQRLAAVTTLQAIPDPAWLPWLADRIAAEKPFIGYHAAVALLSAARAVPDESLDAVDAALTTAVESSSRLRADTDRATTLRYAQEELARRRARAGQSH